MEEVYAYGRGVYLWKGCVPMEGVCTYGRGVYLHVLYGRCVMGVCMQTKHAHICTSMQYTSIYT